MAELAERQLVVEAMFAQYDKDCKGELNPVELQLLHESLRMGGIGIPQVSRITRVHALPMSAYSLIRVTARF